jgi:hypothetical protein
MLPSILLCRRWFGYFYHTGMALAFMGKMPVAVMVGKAISQLPPVLIAIVTSLSFGGRGDHALA